MKKRKLNSTNPKYKKKEDIVEIRTELVAVVKGVKISKLYYI